MNKDILRRVKTTLRLLEFSIGAEFSLRYLEELIRLTKDIGVYSDDYMIVALAKLGLHLEAEIVPEEESDGERNTGDD